MSSVACIKAGVDYEVALEILGQSLRPMINAAEDERKKEVPSLAFIQYCDALIAAVGAFQDELRASDIGTIQRILDPKATFVMRGA